MPSGFRIVVSVGLAVVLIAHEAAYAVRPQDAEMQAARRWVAGVFDGQANAKAGHPASPPFSFVLDSRPSTKFLKTWRLQRAKRPLDAVRMEYTVTYTDPGNRLVLRCVAVHYTDYPAVEWTLHFTNTGKVDTPIIEDVSALDMCLECEADRKCQLDYADGSHELATDFRPRQAELTPGADVRLASFGGRSSDGAMPFFNVGLGGKGGVALGVGWTGQWAATFSREKKSGVRIRAGMERTHLRLHPGESIRTPAMLLLFWDGDDPLRGNNLLRSLLLTHFTPSVAGKPADPPTALSPHGYIAFNDTTEANMLQCISNAAACRLPIDCYWIDAGWSIGGFPGGMGNWDPDPARFPRGLRPVADAAHRNGWRFLLWFEPERVMRNMWLHKNHPEWCLSPMKGLPRELAYQAKDGFFLLNLGNPEALRWATEKTSAMIRDFGIDIYRHDFNMYPSFYWRNDEAPDRQGMNEIRYVTGLYAFFDALRSAHPNVLIDNCASGGRRLDFEMARRSLALLTSDYLWKPVAQQAMMYGLSLWMPLHGFGGVNVDPHDFRSGLGTSFALAIDCRDTRAAHWEPARRLLSEQRQIRHLYWGDFYPLTPYSLDTKTWIAWQSDRPDLHEGMVQAFRRVDCADEIARYKLRGLDPAARYTVVNLDADGSTETTGRQLMDEGLSVRIAGRPGAAIVLYKRMN